MGIAAVPGSGKTTTLAALAVQLIIKRLKAGQRVLVVTYQNSGVDNVRARIQALLEAKGRLPVGYEVRTLHSLAYSIIKENPGLVGVSSDFDVLDQRTASRLLDRSVRLWNQQNPDRWRPSLPDDRPFWVEQWNRVARRVGRQTITLAKHYRLPPERLLERLHDDPQYEPGRLHSLGAEIYSLYQQQVRTLGALDYDDLVRRSVDLLAEQPALAERLRQRWPFVLEDEAQDSVPLQEEMLTRLTGEGGNWVRVGDPNQAIMSTFTASDPEFLNAFLDRPDVQVFTLDEAGRSSPGIIDLANALVTWICDAHPLEVIRKHAFRNQHIQPTPPGDPQKNPSIEKSKIEFRGHASRFLQYQDVVKRATRFSKAYPEMTHAVLVSTNEIGFEFAKALRLAGADVEERLSATTGSRQVADALREILRFIVNPISKQQLADVFNQVWHLGVLALQAGRKEGIEQHIRKYNTEKILYPQPSATIEVSEEAKETLHAFTQLINKWMRAAQLPVDQLLLTVAHDVFTDSRLATAHRIAMVMRGWQDANPQWRLPDLVRELDEGIRNRMLRLEDEDTVFEPQPGVITLTTMHRSKGLEWDFVFLVDVDAERFHYHLEEDFKGEYAFLGGNPEAEVKSAIHALMGKASGPASLPTEAARIDTIGEDCRLLYVGITRARRYLALSWGQEALKYGKTVPIRPAIAFTQFAHQIK